ncbi:MAG: hypothetical protein ABI867_40445, partial [Kofleriaceae bacterium]
MAVPRWLKHPALLAPVAIGAIVLAAFLFIRYMDQRAANHAEDVEAIKAKIPAFFAKTVAGLELEGPDLAPERVYHPVLPIRVDDD